MNNGVQNIRQSLKALLQDLKDGVPLKATKEELRLARKIVDQKEERKNENITEWAERLATQLSKFTD